MLPGMSTGAPHTPPASLTAGLAPADADRALANFYYDHRQWALAIRHYEAALRQGADDANLRTDLGNVYRFAGRFDEALAQYRLAQRMDPTHEPSVFNEGGLHLDGFQDPTAAVAAWEEYLRRFPDGRHAAAAHQLIAQTLARLAVASGTAPPAAPTAGAPPAADAAVQRLLRLTGEAPAGR